MGWRGYPLSALAFDDCLVADEALIGDPGDGFEGMMRMLNAGRLSIAGRCVGVTEHLLAFGAEYAGDRATFGHPLADRDSVKFMLADIATELEAADLMVSRASWFGRRGLPGRPRRCHPGQAAASEMAGRAADAVLQLYGGAGYMADLPLEWIYRDVRAYRIGEARRRSCGSRGSTSCSTTSSSATPRTSARGAAAGVLGAFAGAGEAQHRVLEGLLLTGRKAAVDLLGSLRQCALDAAGLAIRGEREAVAAAALPRR
jgi:hypothetical protein